MPSRRIMNQATLDYVAATIRALPDPRVRACAANHFAQTFNREVTGFDPSRWMAATGGMLSGPTTLEQAP